MSRAFSRGFDRGNYGNAYESQDWDSWYAHNCSDEFGLLSEGEREGMLLGFFSSYELHEIGDDALADEVAALREKWGEEADE